MIHYAVKELWTASPPACSFRIICCSHSSVFSAAVHNRKTAYRLPWTMESWTVPDALTMPLHLTVHFFFFWQCPQISVYARHQAHCTSSVYCASPDLSPFPSHRYRRRRRSSRSSSPISKVPERMRFIMTCRAEINWAWWAHMEKNLWKIRLIWIEAGEYLTLTAITALSYKTKSPAIWTLNRWPGFLNSLI